MPRHAGRDGPRRKCRGGGTYTVKYAVSLYGICEDVDKDGNQLGLTFGPATGEDYTKTYKACDGTSEGSPGNCLHWKSWDEIIALSGTNPHIFDNCLKNGCTHSVELNITGKIAGTSYQDQMDDGDGASMLNSSIASNYLKWNNDRYNYGGWPASRIRAVLNGSDEYTADGTGVSSESSIYYNGDNDVAGTDMEGFTSADALISTFPAELQAAIVPRDVTSDTQYYYTGTTYTFTTYDKLWLFASSEVYANFSSSHPFRPNEGTPYSRTTELNITTSSYAGNKSYKESGSAGSWWLRSPYRGDNISVYIVSTSGGWSNIGATATNLGLAPGFCLNGKQPEKYTVKYAVSIYGINEDVGMPSSSGGGSPADGQTVYQPGEDVAITSTLAAGGDTVTFKPLWEENPKIPLTFGPATGENYVHNFKACPGTSAEAPGTCMHWMPWEQIIEQAKKNPEVFRPCLENGCTHSVLLNITSKIAGTSYQGQMDDGDGAGVLYNSIAKDYRKWNTYNYNYGGWPASRVRATLNGSDEYTADDTGVSSNPSIYYNGYTDQAGTDMEGFTAADALISAFPEELQEAIVPRAVTSDTKYDDYTDTTYTFTTYDKLWLFSGAEVYQDSQDSGSGNEVIRPNEGKPYSRMTELGITTSSCAGIIGYEESGSAYYWWLRSHYRRYRSDVYIVLASGDGLGGNGASSTYYGLAPGFCIG